MYNNQDRINAVKKFKELDAEISKDLDSLVDLVARTCNTPAALITLVDENMQWFKASRGFDIDCTDRELAFYNYTIKHNDVLVINDTLTDKRFSDHPLVTGAPNIRFYAGAPLITKDGCPVGSLCVIDFKSRTIDADQENMLRVLAKQVMNLMELNWSLNTLNKKHEETQKQKTLIQESEVKLKAMFNSSKDTHILVDKELNVMAFNKSAAEFVKQTVGKKIIKGKSIIEYTDPAVIGGTLKLFEQAIGGKTINYQWLMRPGTTDERWKELQFVPIKNIDKEIMGVALNSTDITERKLQQEKINIQNAALTRIAIFQSHELRRPVASLLGILSILKMEQTAQNIDYFDMIEVSINELDEKIRGIVSESENTIVNHLSVVA